MSAKLLYSLSDENPDLQKQIGCMNGIFQLFDRHHFIGGRRVNHKRIPPAGQRGSNEIETNNKLQTPKVKNPKKVVKEKQRISSESSRTSFSSSSCSSTFSSLDCNRTVQLEPLSVNHTIFPETPSRETPMNQLTTSLQLGLRSVDLRDVVKDSIYREARGLSVKTATKEDAAGRTMKHVDSPRPLQLCKSVKPRVSGLNESFQGLAKLRDAHEDSNQGKREGQLLTPKDARRLSYDGRESRDFLKSSIKLKELPRLSLDSRERSIRGSTAEFKSKYLSGNQMENGNTSKILNPQQEPGSCKRPSSVVAKLMGLEVLPDSLSTNEGSIGLSKPCRDEDLDPFSRSPTTANEIQQNRISGSPRNSHKEPISPRMRNVDSVMKPTSTSRILIEPAPWRQPDGSRGSQKQPFKHQKTPTKASNFSPSVYGEIEKRLAELEFKKSGKDLRALKQILDAMQKANGILEETQEEDQASASLSQSSNTSPNYKCHDQSSKLGNLSNLQGNRLISVMTKGTGPPKTFGSPIVIVKPAKLVRNSSNATSSAIPIEGLSGLRKLQIGDSTDGRKVSVHKQTAKDRTPRNNHFRDTSSRSQIPTDKDTTARTLRPTQTSKVPQHRTGENPTSSERSSGALSPRLQQKKLGLQKQARPTIPSSDSSRTRRQPIESGSPRRKLRPKSPNLQQSHEQLSEITSDTRCSSHQGDTISLLSESDISLASQIDTEVTSRDRSDEINGSFFPQGGQKHKNPAARLSENGSMAELATATPEQPSPVSVLDATFYRDDSPSPVKKISNAFKDDETLNSEESGWTSLDLTHFPDSTRPSLSFDIDLKKLENIEQLVQKLRQLNYTHNEPSTDNITPLCENTNPNHRYISEILLASGLLVSDLGSGLTTVQLHPSGQPINTNLFLVLEQIKGKTKFSIDDHVSGKTSPSMPGEKTQRKLMFDVVNELLVHKLGLKDSTEPWFLPNKLAGRNPSGQQLLRELSSEIDQLQGNNTDCSLEDDNESLQQSTNWTDFNSSISMVVLEIERSIFRDLISEVVGGESAGQRVRPSRRCRQLFSK